MADRDPSSLPQGARCPGPGVDDYFAADSRQVPDAIRADSWQPLGDAPLAAARYTSAEFFAQEAACMWPRVWQFVAREEELPEPGDAIVYDNLGKSFLLVRQDDGSIKAFYNVCLHRGRKLRSEAGPARELECPFHGFTWSIDGSFRRMPCAWDFAHLKPEDLALPQVRVARWAGYVMICEDPDAPAFEDYAAPLTQLYKRWRIEECTTVAWVGKVIPANWKVCAEAFMEAWHSIVTHPQILPFTGDANTRYSLWGDHANLALTPFGVLSPHLEGKGHDEQFIVDSFMQGTTRSAGPTGARIPAGVTARQYMADANRKQFLEALGYDASAATDSDLLDAYTYNLFPNFSPWGGFTPNIVYRWRPWPDQDHTLMEVRLLGRKPKDGPMPPAVPMTFLGPDEPWSSYEPWGTLGAIYDQDMANLPYVQDGLKASKNGRVELASYQESRIRHFHQTLDKYLARGPVGG